jgi:hypothetical protein
MDAQQDRCPEGRQKAQERQGFEEEVETFLSQASRVRSFM